MIVTADQQALLEIIFDKINKNSEKAKPYLVTLNSFMASKHTRQRRDIGEIARGIAESNIFEIINPLLEKEVK